MSPSSSRPAKGRARVPLQPRLLANLVAGLDASRIPYMVIGGVAVLVRDVPRLTRDIDLCVDLPPEKAKRLLVALGDTVRPAIRAHLKFARDNGVLPLEAKDGTGVDVIFAATGFERSAIERATLERLGGVDVRVCTVEDLIVLKILAGREKDLLDVRAMVKAAGSKLDRAGLDFRIESLARGVDRPEWLHFWRSVTSKRSKPPRRTP